MTALKIWKSIGITGYHISNYGDVRSKRFPDRMMKSHPNHGGYEFVHISFGNQRHVKYIHKMVAEIFIGKCPKGMEVNHKDGNKQNNRDDNLEYITHARNMKHEACS